MATRFDILLEGYISGTLTPNEAEEFLQLVKDQDHRLPEAVQRLLENEHHPALPVEKEQEMADAILSRAQRMEHRRIPLFRMAAAAAVLVVLGTGLLFMLNNRRQAPPTPRTATTAPVAPGHNKATLILADGTVVPLDSAGEQQIGQGIRQSRGQLRYTAEAKSGSVQFNTLATPRGGQFRLTLPDGSRVWLNSASSLRYPTAFNGRQRVVELKGQGYFEIAQEASQPFIVKVDSMEVQVLGTRFDIMAYPDENAVNTTLLNGAVQVKNAGATRLLRPGQQAVLDGANNRITIQNADTTKVVAWKNGLFLFDNMDLRTILREVSRWYNVEVVYTVTPSSELYGGAISRNMSLEAVLHLLEGNGFNHLKTEGRKILVLP